MPTFHGLIAPGVVRVQEHLEAREHSAAAAMANAIPVNAKHLAVFVNGTERARGTEHGVGNEHSVVPS